MSGCADPFCLPPEPAPNVKTKSSSQLRRCIDDPHGRLESWSTNYSSSLSAHSCCGV